MTRNTKIALWSAGLIGLGTIVYLIFRIREQRRITDIYRKSVNDITKQYNVFN